MDTPGLSCAFGMICSIFFGLNSGKSLGFFSLFRLIDFGWDDSFDRSVFSTSISYYSEIFLCLIDHFPLNIINRLKCVFYTVAFHKKRHSLRKLSLHVCVSFMVFLGTRNDRSHVASFKFFMKVLVG